MSTSASIETGLAASNVAFQVGFANWFSKPLPGAYTFYSDAQKTDAEITEFDFLANYPQMREWIGARREQYLRSYSQRIKLKTFEATLPFPRKSLQYRDKLGTIATAINNWLSQTVSAYDKNAYSVYMSASGAGPTGYDGVALFATTHPHSGSGGNQSNLAAGVALSASTLDTGLVAMNSLTLENAEPAGFGGTHLIVGPALKRRAQQILGADTRVITVDASGKLDAVSSAVAAAAAPNVFNGELTLVVDERRVGTPAFYWDILDCSKQGVRPIVQLIGEAPHPMHQDKLTDPKRFARDQFVYGIEGDWVFDAGMWMSAYRATGTA